MIARKTTSWTDRFDNFVWLSFVVMLGMFTMRFYGYLEDRDWDQVFMDAVHVSLLYALIWLVLDPLADRLVDKYMARRKRTVR